MPLAFFMLVAGVLCAALCIGILYVLISMIYAMVVPDNSVVPASLATLGLTGAWIRNPMLLAIFVGALFLVLLIPIYTLIHKYLSSVGKLSPMGVVQRVVCILLWVAALSTAIPLGFTLADFLKEHFLFLCHYAPS